MVKAGKKNTFNGGQFTAEIIRWVVRWYLQSPINYRDIGRKVTDQDAEADHAILFR